MSDRPLPARRPAAPAPSIERELESAARYAAAALAPATRRAYERDWRVFADWCVARGLAADARPRRRRSRRSWPPRPTASSGRSRSARAPPRSPPRTAPRTSPTRATRRRRRGPGGHPPRARHPPAAQGRSRSSSTRSRGCSSRSTPPRSPACATGRCCCSGSPPRCGAPSSSRSTSRTSRFDAARGLLVTIRRSKADQEQEGAQVAVPYAAGARPLRGPGAAPLPRRRRASTAARCSGRCAAATTSPTGGSQTSPSR